MILVDLDRVSAARPARPLFVDLSLTISDSDRLGIVGINGCGKSTLLRIIAGVSEPESGVIRRGRGVRISHLDQDPSLSGGTLREALTRGRGDQEWEAVAVADRLGLAGSMGKPVADLSGGQIKRGALAELLVSPAELLILDEPTNHLDIDAIAWLEDRLAEHRGGLIVVTHDRHFLDRVTNRVLELDRGNAFIHEGGYQAYLEGRARREEQAADNERKRRNLARTELAWLRRGAPARTSKPKARVAAARTTIESRPDDPARSGQLPLHAKTPRLGDKVIELHGVAGGYETTGALFEGVDLLLDNRERLGIVGVNGTGKSTLLDIMAGVTDPLGGRVEYGPTVRIGYYDQRGRELDPRQRVRDAVAGDKGDVDWTDKALMEAFWFDDDAQWAPIGLLSGGERRRLQLLLTLSEKPNVLLLDEPTNDLDLDTLRSIEDFLDDWPGALVVVSHDRAFLERTVTDVLVLDESTGLGRHPGGYAAYEEQRRAARGGRGAVTGHRGADQRVPTTSPADGYDGSDGPVPRASTGRPTSDSTPSRSTLRFRLKEADRELRSVQKRIAELSGEFEAALGDHGRLGEVGALLAESEAELERVEERWLQLAEQAENLGLSI